MKPCRKNSKPCADCPYKKDSAPGWLGGNSIEQYAEPIIHDIMIPCHRTMNHEEESFCTGLAMVRVNSAKTAKWSPIIRRSEINVEDSEARKECFNFKHEFEEHHENKNH